MTCNARSRVRFTSSYASTSFFDCSGPSAGNSTVEKTSPGKIQKKSHPSSNSMPIPRGCSTVPPAQTLSVCQNFFPPSHHSHPYRMGVTPCA